MIRSILPRLSIILMKVFERPRSFITTSTRLRSLYFKILSNNISDVLPGRLNFRTAFFLGFRGRWLSFRRRFYWRLLIFPFHSSRYLSSSHYPLPYFNSLFGKINKLPFNGNLLFHYDIIKIDLSNLIV